MFGRRSDGKKIKGLNPIQKIMPHLLCARHDSQNLFKYPVRCEKIDKFIEDEKALDVNINYMHIVVASVVRLIALRPQVNRFVMNGRVFRRNKIYVSFVVKKSLRDEAPETTVKLELTGKEDLYEIKEYMDNEINKNNHLKAKNSTDKVARLFTIVPNTLIKFIVWIIKKLDKHGMLSKKIIKASPFHTSVFITNLKSIKTDYIYHHLYDFGTTGLFISMGKEQMMPVVDNNELAIGKVMQLGIVTDERFCDGFYFANTLRLWKRIMDNPQVLKEKLNDIVHDID